MRPQLVPQYDDSPYFRLFEQAFSAPRRLHLAEVTVCLPLPPSLWDQYTLIPYISLTGKKTVRKIPTKALTAFKKEAAERLFYAYRLPCAEFPWKGAREVGIEALVLLPNWRSDLENRIKAAVDVVAPYLGFNDNRVVELHARKIVGEGRGIVLHLYILSGAKVPRPLH